MKSLLKKFVNRSLRPFGYRVHRLQPGLVTGLDLFDDLKSIIGSEAAICLDIGANLGQTIDNLIRVFKNPSIHAFEPASSTFTALSARKLTVPGSLKLVHCAMGSSRGKLEFINYESADLSSLLPLSESEENCFRGVREIGRELVPVDTVDDYLERIGISIVDVLKSDTQGYELEVLRGATRSLSAGRIKVVVLEMNFVSLYEAQSRPALINQLLIENGFRLVDFYEKARVPDSSLGWCTAMYLYINRGQ